MKNTAKYLYALLVLFGVLACRDESKNPIPTSTMLDGVTFVAVAKSSAFLDANNPTGNMVFETSSERPDNIAKVQVMAEYLPAVGNKIQNIPLLTLPAITGTTTIAYSQIFTALGISPSVLKPGDVLRAKFVATTTDGRTFSEDNTVNTLPTTGSSAFTRAIAVTVACVFDSKQFATGTWLVTQDGWQDYPVGAAIKVTPGPGANELTVGIYATDLGHKDLVLTVSDVNTGAVTVAKQVYGAYAPDPAIWSAQGTGSISGCAGTITLSLVHSSPTYGSYGPYTFKLVRK